MCASRLLHAARLLVLVPLFVPVAASGQGRDCLLVWRLRAFTLQNREYFDPLIAEPRAANIKVVFPAWADPFRHGAPSGSFGRRVWDISLGKEIPIHGCEKGDARNRRLAPGEWGVGLWLPISFHMVEDLKDESAPIVNTDYRFAGMLKAQLALSRQRYVGLRYVFAGHESTHLGDEFSLAAQRRGAGFERINVSYEYWELAGSFEQRAPRHTYRLHAGAVKLFHPDRGYYSADTAETNGRFVVGSTNATEPYAGAEWVSSVAIRPPLLDLAPYISADVRFKTVYDYHKTDPNAAEDRQWSVNVMVGLKRPEKHYLERGVPNLFVQLYHGVNPHGQFREQRSWSMIGLGIHVPM